MIVILTIYDSQLTINQDVVGEYTGMNILVGSHLSFSVIRNKLTLKIGNMVPIIEDEVSYALKEELGSIQSKQTTIPKSLIIFVN
jgi:hypothetical protein